MYVACTVLVLSKRLEDKIFDPRERKFVIIAILSKNTLKSLQKILIKSLSFLNVIYPL